MRLRLLLLAVVLLSACGAPKPILLDLARDLAVADHETPGRQLVLFGSPSSDPFLAKGFFREADAAGGERFAWARREAYLELRFAEVAPRVALLDAAPYPGVSDQTARVSLNEVPVGLCDVATRRSCRFELPAEAQKAGLNRIGLSFAKIAPRDNPHGRRFAAAVYALTVGSEATPMPFVVTAGEAGASRLAQTGPSVLRYALRVAGGEELRFTPSGPARLRVTLEQQDGLERELWSRPVGAGGASAEVAVPLGAAPAAIVRVGLHVDEGRGVWGGPRIVGPPPISLSTAGPDERAAALRKALAGANVLFILLDAAGAKHFGCYGYPRATTPEIDRLAAEGVVFERAYTPAVFTLAAMGSVWTSLPPDEHRRGGPYDAKLPAGPLTLAELLGANGVATAGWVANGMAGPAFGLDRGFGEFHETYREQHGYNADAFAAVLPAWFEAHKDRRFFAYAHFREPHFPYDPPAAFRTRFGPDAPLPAAARSEQAWVNAVNFGKTKLSAEDVAHLVRLYDGGLAFADQQIGALRKALEASGLWERTVVVVAADHGEALFEHGFVGHNQQLYEESVRIPLVVRFPRGAGPVGTRVGALVDLLDLAPTIADLFGLIGAGGADRAFKGRSLLPVAFGAPGRDAVFTRNAAGERPSYAVRDGRFAFLRDTRYGREELFDHAKDPGEAQDILGRDAVAASCYRQRLFRFLLALKRGQGEDGVPAELTAEQRENLKALGYLQ